MENHGILNWHNWPNILKASILAAFAGVALTAAIDWLFRLLAREESMISLLLAWAYAIVLWPARQVAAILNWSWPLDGYVVAGKSIGLALLTNAICLAIVGALVAWLLNMARPKT